MVAGKVNRINRGFMNASSKERTTAIISAVKKSLIDTPGKMNSRINTLTEQTNILNIHFSMPVKLQLIHKNLREQGIFLPGF